MQTTIKFFTCINNALIMKTLHGLTIVGAGCQDKRLNIFFTEYNDGTRIMFRQSRKPDSGDCRVARKKISDDNWERYRRRNVDQIIYDMKYRCKMPLYKGECPGILPLIIELDGDIVGFSDVFFNTGEYFSRYKVEPESKCCNGSIIAVDKYQGLGIGTAYASTSNAIGRHYGCTYILGTTFMKSGMYQIRQKDGCVTTRKYTNGMVDHKKRL